MKFAEHQIYEGTREIDISNIYRTYEDNNHSSSN